MLHALRIKFTSLVTWLWCLVLHPVGWRTFGSTSTEDGWRRWFMHLEDDPGKGGIPRKLRAVHYQIVWGQWRYGLSATFSIEPEADETIQLVLSIPLLFWVYIGIETSHTWAANKAGMWDDRRWGFSISPRHGIVLDWAYGEIGYTGNQRGRHWRFWWDQLKGKSTSTFVEYETVTLTFTQPAWRDRWPASEHTVELTKSRQTTHYGNWFVPDVSHLNWDLKLSKPPQYEGKGEDAWNCGLDATYQMSYRASCSADEAVQRYIQHVQCMRDKRGG